MINPDIEELIALKDVPDALPPMPRKPGYQAVLMWTTRGVRGVILETVWIGGRKYTTRRDLEEFMAQISHQAKTKQLTLTSHYRERKKTVNEVLVMIGRDPIP